MSKFYLTLHMKTSGGLRFTVFFSLLACALHCLAIPASPGLRIKAGNQEFIVEGALTREQQIRGLMNRKSLSKSHGLLMIFDHDKRIPIWMKNMRFPLDVVWLSAEGVILDLKTLPICKEMPCKIYFPASPARFVLEVGAGLFPLNRGDKVEIIDTSRDSLHPLISATLKSTDPGIVTRDFIDD